VVGRLVQQPALRKQEERRVVAAAAAAGKGRGRAADVVVGSTSTVGQPWYEEVFFNSRSA